MRASYLLACAMLATRRALCFSPLSLQLRAKEVLRMGSSLSRDEHNLQQAETFDRKVGFFASEASVPPEAQPSLREIAEYVAKEKGIGRVVDVGTGTGCLLPFYAEAGIEQSAVVGVDLSPKMLEVFKERWPKAESWLGDFIDYLPGEGTSSIGAVVFNAVFGNVWDQRAHLAHAGYILGPGGSILLCHPLGRKCPEELRAKDPGMVPHALPDEAALLEMTRFLPLQLRSFTDAGDLYLAVLKLTPQRACQSVMYLSGVVSQGYGRGSKKLGVPTANLPASQFTSQLEGVQNGVYFGWGQVDKGAEKVAPCVQQVVHKVVANVGYSPTFEGQENPEKIAEAHLISYGEDQGDFYGSNMRLALCGFLRPERKFDSFPALVAQINQDVQVGVCFA
ncbi:unnamed protein product [Chrysoparadoxa australica]